MSDHPESEPRRPDEDRPAAPPGFDDLLRRMIDMPPKPHADMKVGKPRAKKRPGADEPAGDADGRA
jgi:hypothetical protein